MKHWLSCDNRKHGRGLSLTILFLKKKDCLGKIWEWPDMFCCLILFPAYITNNIVSSAMKRGRNGWIISALKEASNACPFLFWNQHLHAWLLSLFPVFPSASLARRCSALYSVRQWKAGSLAPWELAGSCSSRGEAWTALPAGSVRSPAKPRRRDLCQYRIGAANKKKKIFCRCLKAFTRSRSRLSGVCSCL